ncbi:MAG TPA: FAD-dependent oxidoreductase [Chloroflexota bacterium]|nr:FAD-dependent oxidoreductase [Chloroflexota bacterium]
MSGLLRHRTYLRAVEPKPRYDVIIIGGGGHGLATAYYLASRHGVTNIAVLERSYIGAGATGRNTTVVRANYKMPESVAFFKRSYELYEGLSVELDYNLLMSRRGLFWLAHSENVLRLQRERALLNQAFGVDTVFIGPDEIQKLCPQIDLEAGGKGKPIIGASYHPPGSVIRHDAVVWGYAAAAQRLGVHVHEGVNVTGITRQNGRAIGVETTAGPIAAGTIVSATAGYTSAVAALAGLRLPITTHPLQAFVTEPYGPILDRIVASSDLLVYISQTSRGEILVGAEIERYTTYSTRSTFSFLAECASRAIDLLPFTAKLKILRQWTGLCDMSPDYSPLMGLTEVDGFVVTAGWGTWGFKAIPASGMAMAELVATGKVPALIAPFRIDRFRDDRAIPDRSSAGTH